MLYNLSGICRDSAKLFSKRCYASAWLYVFSLVVLSSVLAAGCTSARGRLMKPHRARTQQQAGSVNVSVLRAEPWDKYVDELQADFKLNEKQALAEVVNSTLIIEERLVDSIAGAGKVAFRRDYKTSSETRVTAGGDSESTTETERHRGPGDVDDIGFDDVSYSGGGVAGAADVSPLSVDPFLKYNNALSLYQEVKLASSAVVDAARRRGCVPYLVQVNLATVPLARHQPYDVYVSLSFFPGEAAPQISVRKTPFNGVEKESLPYSRVLLLWSIFVS